jgi:hypothetical protein
MSSYIILAALTLSGTVWNLSPVDPLGKTACIFWPPG